MSYVKSEEHPGWIYDSEYDDYISPSGRTTTKPGAPFTGALTKIVFEKIKELSDPNAVIEKSPQKQEQEVSKFMATPKDSNVTLTLVKTYRKGDITINLYHAH